MSPMESTTSGTIWDIIFFALEIFHMRLNFLDCSGV